MLRELMSMILKSLGAPVGTVKTLKYSGVIIALERESIEDRQ